MKTNRMSLVIAFSFVLLFGIATVSCVEAKISASKEGQQWALTDMLEYLQRKLPGLTYKETDYGALYGEAALVKLSNSSNNIYVQRREDTEAAKDAAAEQSADGWASFAWGTFFFDSNEWPDTAGAFGIRVLEEILNGKVIKTRKSPLEGKWALYDNECIFSGNTFQLDGETGTFLYTNSFVVLIGDGIGVIPMKYSLNSGRLDLTLPWDDTMVFFKEGVKVPSEAFYNVQRIPTGDAVVITEYLGSEKDVVIPAKIDGVPVRVIGEYAFASHGLTSVTIPNSVTSILEEAFSDNELTSIAIPNGVTIIGDSAFYDNELTSVIIPDSVTTIGEYAFANNKLTNIAIPNSVTIIGDSAFYDNEITSVIIPNSVTIIGDSAFYDNEITSVIIPDSVTSLADDAFDDEVIVHWTEKRGM